MTRADKLRALAAVLRSPLDAERVLSDLEAQGLTIYRKKVANGPRRPGVSQPMTKALRSAIKATHHAQPQLTQQEIATKFNVNIGRVSEALR